MKKTWLSAILILCLGACYTPLNNSGVATTKPWLEVSGKKLDFDGKQYDSCYQFNIHFWPPEAVEQIDLQKSCISACCWRSDQDEVTLDFNKNFERDLAYYGRAKKYSPDKITFKVTHSNLVNTTKVTVTPRGVIKNNGLVKLSYKEYENPSRLAQLEAMSRQLQTRRNAYLNEQRQQQDEAARNSKKKNKEEQSAEARAKALLVRKAGTKIDTYFYEMNKTYTRQGAVFMLSERILNTSPLNTQGDYSISCHAQARTGINSKKLKASSFSSGTWRVSLQDETVLPDDRKALQIMQQQ